MMTELVQNVKKVCEQSNKLELSQWVFFGMVFGFVFWDLIKRFLTVYI